MSFYEFLRSAPYVRLLLPFMVGILLGQDIPLPEAYVTATAGFSFIVLICFGVFYRPKYSHRWVWGVFLNVTLIFLGLFTRDLDASRKYLPDHDILVLGTIMENPHLNSNSQQVLLRLDAMNVSGEWVKVNHKVTCTVQKKGNWQISINEQLLLKGKWKEIRNSGNPYEFDYKLYMNRLGCYYTSYFDTVHWLSAGENKAFNLSIRALKLRNNILDYFKQLNLTPSAFGVISALTVGDKSYLDAETKSAFVNSGTIHILAVSGMHVALLFWLLQQLTKPLMFWKRGKVIRFVLVMVVIWIYAMITGLTPSVVRASVMFTFWMIGDASNRNNNIYNTISASALLLLALDPDNLFDAGFQLSYLAVLGIVVFYKDIYNWIYVKNKVLKYLWSGIAVSLAAQLFTLPVTLYDFHQFPNYFLLANTLALPLSTVILYGSILALVLAPFKILWIPLGWVLKILVGCMNAALVWVENLPYALTTGINISVLVAISLFLLVIAFRAFLFNRKATYLILSLVILVFISISWVFEKFRVEKSREIIVFNSPSLVMHFRKGPNVVVISDSLSQRVERLAKPVNDHSGISKYTSLLMKDTVLDNYLYVHKGFIRFGDLMMFVWNDRPAFCKTPVDIDVLIIEKLKKRDIELIGKTFHPRQIIITSKVYPAYAGRLKKEFMTNSVSCNVLNADGAWVWDDSKKNDE